MAVEGSCPCCAADVAVEEAAESMVCPACGVRFLCEAAVAFRSVRASEDAAAGDFVIEDGVLRSYVGSGGDVRVPEGVRAVGTQAFGGCAGLLSVELPEGLTEVGEGAFARCTSLASVRFPSTVNTIMADAFARCVCLRSVSFAPGIDQGAVSIDEDAFYCCGSIDSVEGWDGELGV